MMTMLLHPLDHIVYINMSENDEPDFHLSISLKVFVLVFLLEILVYLEMQSRFNNPVQINSTKIYSLSDETVLQ